MRDIQSVQCDKAPSSTAAADVEHNNRLDPADRRGSIFSKILSALFGISHRPEPHGTMHAQSEAKRRWRLLQVESALACNIRCIMCPWKDYRANAEHRGIMPGKIWDAIRPILRHVQSVDFTGGGEPLLQPLLAQWVEDAKSAGCETGILTNGLLLSRDIAHKLISVGLDWICVSIDAADKAEYERIRVGSNFEKVCENLANIGEIRSRGIPKTMINFVIMKSNIHQLDDMVRLVADLAVDQINFKQCEVIRGEHGKGLGVFGREETAETRRLKKTLSRAQKLAHALGVQTTVSSLWPSQRPVCEQDPRDSMFVRYDGLVAPCISLANGGVTTFLGQEAAMPSVIYGRLPDDDLLELWDTETCAFYRERFERRVRAYEETFIQGLLSDSLRTPQRMHELAVQRMADAPEGCRICHFLYGI